MYYGKKVTDNIPWTQVDRITASYDRISYSHPQIYQKGKRLSRGIPLKSIQLPGVVHYLCDYAPSHIPVVDQWGINLPPEIRNPAMIESDPYSGLSEEQLRELHGDE